MIVQTHTECVPDKPGMTHDLGQRLQNFENPIFTSGKQEFFFTKVASVQSITDIALLSF